MGWTTTKNKFVLGDKIRKVYNGEACEERWMGCDQIHDIEVKLNRPDGLDDPFNCSIPLAYGRWEVELGTTRYYPPLMLRA